MKPAQTKATDEMRMSGKEFDRIMGQALQAKPKDGKPKKAPQRKQRSKTPQIGKSRKGER